MAAQANNADDTAPEGYSPIVVTERMKAIARGENPDKIAPAPELGAQDDDGDDDAPPTATSPAGDGERASNDVEDGGTDADDTAASNDPPAAGATDWIDDRTRAVARSYGIDDESLELFDSAADFGKHLRLIDVQTARTAPKAPAADGDDEGDETAVDDKEFIKDGKLNLKYYDKAFDPDTKILVQKIDELESKLTEREQSEQAEKFQAAWNQYANALHNELDALRPDFYGKSVDASGKPVKLSDEYGKRRTEINDTVIVLSKSYQDAGKPAPKLSSLVRTAEQMVFGDEIAALEAKSAGQRKQAKLEGVAAQSRTRRGVANSSVNAADAYRQSPPANPHSSEAIYKHPKVQAVVRRIYETNGSDDQ